MKSNMANRIFRLAARAVVLAVALLAAAACDNTIEADPIVVQYAGSIKINFNWTDSNPSCPQCLYSYATVRTAALGDFNYGPLPFSSDGIYLSEVLSGYNHTIVVWITDSAGEVLYRGVVLNVHVIADTENTPVTADIYPKGWYPVTVTQAGQNWALNDVKMSGDGAGWMAGSNDNTGLSNGVIFQGGGNAWALENPNVSSSTNWDLNSIAPDGAGAAWAVGSDLQHSTGIIVRNAGGIWFDDVTEPDPGGIWTLNGVDFDDSGIGYAVGESEATTSEAVILKYDGAWSIFAHPATPVDKGLWDVASLPGGDFVAVGTNYGTSPASGYAVSWDNTGASFTQHDPTTTVCSGNQWNLADVSVISKDDWWAVGTCWAATSYGMIFHYTTANGLEPVTTGLTAPAGSWTMNGIWAGASGEVWVVGGIINSTGLIYHLKGGVWESVTAKTGLTSWNLNDVDFPPTGWGYAVGKDNLGGSGLIMRYGFPL